MPKDRRQKRDLHALDAEGMVLCNPRDKEAAHRAQMEGIATDDHEAVTCRKCLSLLHKLGKAEEPLRERPVAECAAVAWLPVPKNALAVISLAWSASEVESFRSIVDHPLWD